MSVRVYNRGKPNKKFGSLKIEQSSIDYLKIDNLLTNIANKTEFNTIAITDVISKNNIIPNGYSNILIGVNAGTMFQGNNSIACGTEAGTYSQKDNSISIGYLAGNKVQGEKSISIGFVSGYSNQGPNSISIGTNSGYKFQGPNAVSIGESAGYNNQKANSVAIGYAAGNICQGTSSISIGKYSGSNGQGNYCIAIGSNAGKDDQNINSIAIGNNVGELNLGKKSIVIGNNIVCDQDNSLVINTSDETIIAQTNGLFIGGALIERNTGGDFRYLVYNKDTKQIVYQPQTAQSIDYIFTSKKGQPTPVPGPATTVVIGYDLSTTAIMYEVFSVTGDGNKQTIRLFQSDPTNLTLLPISDNNDGMPNFIVTISEINTENKVITLTFSPLYTGTTATPFITVTRFV